MQDDRRLSQHPVDVAIRDILQAQRPPSVSDAGAVVERMASATFKTGRRRLPQPLLELMSLHGYSTDQRMTELTFHWAKHVLGDGQWSPEIDEVTYLEHLRRVVEYPESRLFLQRRNHRSSAAIAIANTVDIVPPELCGSGGGTEIVVVYSADLGKILSGYMIDTSLTITSEPRTIWLRE